MIGKRLIELRNKKKMTQKQVATRLKISRSTYSNYESDFREPDFKNVEILADIFEVSVDYLLGREAKEPSIEETNRERIIRETQELMKLAKDDQQAQLMLDLAKNVFKK